jgi:hypothetical protein
MHVMKTAGTSLELELASGHPPGATSHELGLNGLSQFFHKLSTRAWQQLPPQAHEKLRYYSGHVPLAAAEVIPRKPIVVTVLRDPIMRTLSWLRQAQREHPEHQGKSLEEIYEDPWWNDRFLANHQVKLLSMTLEEALTPPWSGILEPAEGEAMERALGAGYEPTDDEAVKLFAMMNGARARSGFEFFGPNTYLVECDDERLRRALQAVDEIDVVGLTSQLPMLITALEQRLGRTIKLMRVNRSPSATPVSAAFRRRIALDNAYDMTLHSYVRYRLETESLTTARSTSALSARRSAATALPPHRRHGTSAGHRRA